MSHFSDILKEMQELHDKKSHDYATSTNPFSNFEIAAEFAGISVNEQFDSLIGTKIARLGNLLRDKKKAQNESLEDSFKDLATYCVLRLAYQRYNKDRDVKIDKPMLPDGSRSLEDYAKDICLCGNQRGMHQMQKGRGIYWIPGTCAQFTWKSEYTLRQS